MSLAMIHDRPLLLSWARVRATALCIVPVVGLASCSSDDEGTDHGASTSSASTGVDDDANADTMDEDTSQGDADSDTAGESCVDAPALGPVVHFTLHNARDQPMLITNTRGSECWDDVVPLEIAAEGGGPLLWRRVMGEWSCQSFLNPNFYCGFGCGAVQAGIVLDPGGTFEGTWAGSEWTSVETPTGCVTAESCADCFVEDPVPAGRYRVTAYAHELEVPCEDPQDGGWCHIEAQGVSGDIEISVILDYPRESQVDLVVE
jgi:hypothetical protein